MLKRSGSIGNTDSGSTDAEGNTTHYGKFSFFSRETHTVYQPKLEVVWNDSKWATGSLSALSSDNLSDMVFYMRGFRPEYKENSKVKFRLVGRERYPEATYSTGSLTIEAGSNVTLTGVEATYATGTLNVFAGTEVNLSGQVATYSVGTLNVQAASGVTLTGQEATFATGTFTFTADSNLTLTGQQATWYVNPDQYPLWAWTKETGGSTTETWTRELGKAA